jgi:periplasmic divalent cation tolerance protein
MASDLRTVLVTAPDIETAESLAEAVVGERLAACANLVPGVVSIYRWEGEVHRDGEVLLVLKTTAARAEALRKRVVALHPYEVPEVLVLAVDEGHEPYEAWVRDQVEVAP